jgi:hypothetical protein
MAQRKADLRVEIDGKTVWDGTGHTVKDIPAEYRDRPADGDPAHHLYMNDVLVGVQRSLAEDEPDLAARLAQETN